MARAFSLWFSWRPEQNVLAQSRPLGQSLSSRIDCRHLSRNLSRMKVSATKSAAQSEMLPRRATSDDGIDLTLLEESLAKTVWERMLANDDALRLADMLQAATLKARAKS